MAASRGTDMMRIKLTELRPLFITYSVNPTDKRIYHITAPFPTAHGIRFLCPKCMLANNMDSRGVHGVICWFEGRVPDSAKPGPGRWNPTGTGFDDLSFVPGKKSQSIQLEGGCAWHGYITNGLVTEQVEK